MNSALWHVTLSRFREFYLEPAAHFWVYGFPLTLAFTLGLAFRERTDPASIVDVQLDPLHPEVSEGIRDSFAGDATI
jgi:hypothetical protein